jgi:hypothetical protein
MTRHWRNLPRSLELRRWIRWRYFTGEGWRLRSYGRVIGMHLDLDEIFRGMKRPSSVHRRVGEP